MITKKVRTEKLSSSNGRCEVCGGLLNQYGTPQLAHCIADTKTFNKKYGTFFVGHPLNLKWTCSLACNQVCNIGYNKGEVLKKLADIVMYEMQKHAGEVE